MCCSSIVCQHHWLHQPVFSGPFHPRILTCDEELWLQPLCMHDRQIVHAVFVFYSSAGAVTQQRARAAGRCCQVPFLTLGKSLHARGAVPTVPCSHHLCMFVRGWQRGLDPFNPLLTDPPWHVCIPPAPYTRSVEMLRGAACQQMLSAPHNAAATLPCLPATGAPR